MTEAAADGFEAYDSTAMEWDQLHIDALGRSIPVKAFTADPDTGMTAQLIKYEAGFINPWHTHHCAHGIFVISGTLRTHKGEFGAGSFVWLPEGMTMFHGATEEQDCEILFITNKPFDIHYPFEDEPAGTPEHLAGQERAAKCSMESVR